MLLDIGVTSRMHSKEVVRLCRLAETLGFYGAWIGEDLAVPRDIFTLTSIALLKTSTLRVGIGITSPLIRNISTVARAAVTLAETSENGRFRLGLGVGGLQDLSNLEIQVKGAVDTMRDAISLLRRIWKGETLSFNKGNFHLEHYYNRYCSSRNVPIFLGVRGPRLLRLAGEVADGVILSGPRTYLEKAVAMVKKGIHKSECPARTFKFVVWVPTILTLRGQGESLARQSVAFVLADTPMIVLKMAELDLEKVGKVKKAFQLMGLEEATKHVTEELVEEVVISGSPRELCQTFGFFGELGINEVVFGPPYGLNRERAIAKLARAWGSHA